MSHISYSELKDWKFCPFYHKLTRIDGIDGFTGNEYTAFGSAIHSVCEKKLLQEEIDDDFFVKELKKNIAALDDEIDNKIVHQMMKQGNNIIPEIDDALSEYFEEYEVLAVEMPLMEDIAGHDEYKFKGFIDAIVVTPDGKVHIFDWKTCSWGWDSKNGLKCRNTKDAYRIITQNQPIDAPNRAILCRMLPPCLFLVWGP